MTPHRFIIRFHLKHIGASKLFAPKTFMIFHLCKHLLFWLANLLVCEMSNSDYWKDIVVYMCYTICVNIFMFPFGFAKSDYETNHFCSLRGGHTTLFITMTSNHMNAGGRDCKLVCISLHSKVQVWWTMTFSYHVWPIEDWYVMAWPLSWIKRTQTLNLQSGKGCILLHFGCIICSVKFFFFTENVMKTHHVIHLKSQFSCSWDGCCCGSPDSWMCCSSFGCTSTFCTLQWRIPVLHCSNWPFKCTDSQRRRINASEY